MTEKQNANQFPRVYYCRHMQPGTAKYDNETLLVDTDAVKNMIPSGVGKPVYIDHQKVNLKNLKEEMAGVISESFYNELDGWAWFKFVAIDDRAHEVIAKGWSVSNAYIPTEISGGGTKNNCSYDREVRNGEFTHLAIVSNPRYEGALIMSPTEFKDYQENHRKKLEEMQNSKPKGTPMIKLFKNKKEEVSTIDADTLIEIDGKEVTIQEMVNSVTAGKKAEKEIENGEQLVDVDGEQMTLNELRNKYCAMNEKKNKAKAKKNEDSDDEMEAEDEEALMDGEKAELNKKAKKNKVKKNEAGDESDGDAKKDDEKKNSSDTKEIDSDDDKHFEELRNANRKAEFSEPMIEISQTTLQRGQSKYGSAKK